MSWWNIDYFQHDLGSVDSWSAKPLTKYMLHPYKVYESEFTLFPYDHLTNVKQLVELSKK